MLSNLITKMNNSSNDIINYLAEHFNKETFSYGGVGTVFWLRFNETTQISFRDIGGNNETCMLMQDSINGTRAIVIHSVHTDGHLTWEKLGRIIALFTPYVLAQYDAFTTSKNNIAESIQIALDAD